MNDDNASRLTRADVLELHVLALEDDVAGVAACRMHPRQHVHQRRLAGAVLTADGVDLPGMDGDGDVRESLHSRELLGDGAHLEDGGVSRHRHTPP